MDGQRLSRLAKVGLPRLGAPVDERIRRDGLRRLRRRRVAEAAQSRHVDAVACELRMLLVGGRRRAVQRIWGRKANGRIVAAEGEARQRLRQRRAILGLRGLGVGGISLIGPEHREIRPKRRQAPRWIESSSIVDQRLLLIDAEGSIDVVDVVQRIRRSVVILHHAGKV